MRWTLDDYSEQLVYPPLNQVQNRTDFNAVTTFDRGDDRNIAAVMLRGRNTSLLYNCGRNFQNIPVSDFVSGPFHYPCPRVSQLTSQIRSEPTYVSGRPRAAHFLR